MKRKLIKIVCLLSIVLLVFLIYKTGNTGKMNYIALGDSIALGQTPYKEVDKSYTDYLAYYLKNKNKLLAYNHEYPKSGYKAQDIINDIKKDFKLKKDLRESDLVTISVGANDLLERVDLKNIEYASTKDIIKDIAPSIDSCIKEIRKYAKEKIVIVGYYNPVQSLFYESGNNLDLLFAYIDSEYKKIAEKYDCIYVSNYELFKKHKEFLPNTGNIHPNLEGYKNIAKQIEKAL